VTSRKKRELAINREERIGEDRRNCRTSFVDPHRTEVMPEEQEEKKDMEGLV
jgi:hypothetical protein